MSEFFLHLRLEAVGIALVLRYLVLALGVPTAFNINVRLILIQDHWKHGLLVGIDRSGVQELGILVNEVLNTPGGIFPVLSQELVIKVLSRKIVVSSLVLVEYHNILLVFLIIVLWSCLGGSNLNIDKSLLVFNLIMAVEMIFNVAVSVFNWPIWSLRIAVELKSVVT